MAMLEELFNVVPALELQPEKLQIRLSNGKAVDEPILCMTAADIKSTLDDRRQGGLSVSVSRPW